ncbi:MAG: PHP domain-containing protein [Bacteroidales bacterium]|nr:PHP domain-containing protein [Bacteroidales bacterium]
MGYYDNHNHCQFSFDGKRTTIEASVSGAIANGLSGMCFTDHCDFYTPPMKASHENLVPETFDIPAQQAEIDRVAAVLKGHNSSENINIQNNTNTQPQSSTNILSQNPTLPKNSNFNIYKGIEIGLYNSCRGQIRETLEKHSFDEVIASVHYLDDTDPFWGGYYEGKTWKEAYGHYLETLYNEMTWLEDFDIMGHFDYVARYAPYPKASILYRDFPDLFDAMLQYLAYNGKALEINTKTYRDYSGRLPELDPDILKRFRELGGEMISLGSDSHDPVRPGANFPRFAALSLSCGFKHLVHFSSRQPLIEPI